MNNNLDWEITCERFIVFLDILGFKDMVSRNSHNDIYNKLKLISKIKEDYSIDRKLIEEKTLAKELYLNVFITNFSDSIIIFSKDNSFDSFAAINICATQIFSTSINSNIPIKGAIATGVLTVDIESQIFFGQPLIDAFLLQEEVNYFGLIAHNSIDSYIKSCDDVYQDNLKFYYFEASSSLKNGQIIHTNLNWFRNLLGEKRIYGLDIKSNSELTNIFFSRMNIIRLGVSGYPRKYIDNTINFFNNNSSVILLDEEGVKNFTLRLESILHFYSPINKD